MNQIKKYNYSDWVEGKICLNYSFLQNEIADKPETLNWSSIIENDIPKIKLKQKKYLRAK